MKVTAPRRRIPVMPPGEWPFSLCPGELADLFRVRGERRPDHVDRVPRFAALSAPVHPVIALEMANGGLDLDPLPGRPPETGPLAVGMGTLPFLGDGHSLCFPWPPAVLLLLERLI